MLALSDYGFTNSVGVSGKRLSDQQISLIVDNADSAIVWFDDLNDSIRAADYLEFYIPVEIVHSDKDPADSTLAEVLEAMSQRKSLFQLHLDWAEENATIQALAEADTLTKETHA